MGFMIEQFNEEEKKALIPFVSNLDRDVFVLKNLPEVIKGALFSRYSRSSKSLRRLLLDEFILSDEGAFKEIVTIGKESGNEALAIEKAQNFYDRILDGYGDDSIGELGGAHLACENVSNLASKALENPRIGGSPLEKSTRYLFFDKKVDNDYQFYKEPKIMKSELAELYLQANRFLFDTYANLIDPMKKFVMEKFPQEENVPDIAYKFSVRARACDALRGLLPTSTLTNLGIFGNGRLFENLILRFRADNLSEMNNLADNVQTELNSVIPSFVRRCRPDNKHFKSSFDFLKNTANFVLDETKRLTEIEVGKKEALELVDYDEDAEEKVLSSLLYENSKLPLSQLRQIIKDMNIDERKKLLSFLDLRQNRRHKPPRAFENCYYTFDVLTDFGSYRDLQRHRMLTQERQNLTTLHGFYVPEEITSAGFENDFREAMDKAEHAYKEIYNKFPKESQYIVPFAYKVRWYMKMNLRSVYWISELRSVEQGHPTYRHIAQQMYLKTKEVHPALSEYMKYVDMNEYGLGRLKAEVKKEEKG